MSDKESTDYPSVILLDQTITTDNKLLSTLETFLNKEILEKGFTLNVLVIGKRGLGCKTLINGLFDTNVISSDRDNGINNHLIELSENQIRLSLNITTYHDIHTPNKITEFIKEQNTNYYTQEMNLQPFILDNRIHCCLFLISGNKINNDEVETLKIVSKYCNTIPVITKLDTYTEEELSIITSDFEKMAQNFTFYHPTLLLFSSEKTHEIENEIKRGRKYSWGFVDVELYGDFKKLQSMLLFESYVDLKEKTNIEFYKNYRNSISKVDEVIDTVSLDDDIIEKVLEKNIQILNDLKKEKNLLKNKEVK